MGAGGTMDPHVFAFRFALGCYVLVATYGIVFLGCLLAGRPYMGIGVGVAASVTACWLTWVVGLWLMH
jgi:hypothetical protein